MEVEWIILADAAEVVNNKLYLIGGGWETLTISSSLPHTHNFSVAVAFNVPWDEADRQHHVSIAIADQHGAELADVEGQVEVGRPHGIPLGNAQRVQMAIKLALTLQWLGKYSVIARVEGKEARRTSFNVVAGHGFAAPQSGGNLS